MHAALNGRSALGNWVVNVARSTLSSWLKLVHSIKLSEPAFTLGRSCTVRAGIFIRHNEIAHILQIKSEHAVHKPLVPVL